MHENLGSILSRFCLTEATFVDDLPLCHDDQT
jgi:hypothetical protein